MSDTVPEYVVVLGVCFSVCVAAKATDPLSAMPARALQKTLNVFMNAFSLSEKFYSGCQGGEIREVPLLRSIHLDVDVAVLSSCSLVSGISSRSGLPRRSLCASRSGT